MPAMVTGLPQDAKEVISAALTELLADMFSLYIKTKNFHWHVTGPNFPQYHAMFDDQATQILNATDGMAERARKIGGMAIRSINQIARLSRILDNEMEYVSPSAMILELYENNVQIVTHIREVIRISQSFNDDGTTAMLEVWLDEAERRVWFLYISIQPTPAARVGGPA